MAEENQSQQSAQPDPERNTRDDGAKMTGLEHIRHSCAHAMATAILRRRPDAPSANRLPLESRRSLASRHE